MVILGTIILGQSAVSLKCFSIIYSKNDCEEEDEEIKWTEFQCVDSILDIDSYNSRVSSFSQISLMT